MSRDTSDPPVAAGPKTSRIRARNRERILAAAQEVFAEYGYHGATIDKVAGRVEMSQPNLHHYFPRKTDLYDAVLARILDIWLVPLEDLDPNGDPREELGRYIADKIELSRLYPAASRVFATEIIQGAPVLGNHLRTVLRDKVEQKAAVIQGWIDAGKLAPVDPHHLIFLIWAATQHYADFMPQLRAVMNVSRFTKAHYAAAAQSISAIVLNGVAPARP